jgi:hypothetical protein
MTTRQFCCGIDADNPPARPFALASRIPHKCRQAQLPAGFERCSPANIKFFRVDGDREPRPSAPQLGRNRQADHEAADHRDGGPRSRWPYLFDQGLDMIGHDAGASEAQRDPGPAVPIIVDQELGPEWVQGLAFQARGGCRLLDAAECRSGRGCSAIGAKNPDRAEFPRPTTSRDCHPPPVPKPEQRPRTCSTGRRWPLPLATGGVLTGACAKLPSSNCE